jgi:hypothetical protein
VNPHDAVCHHRNRTLETRAGRCYLPTPLEKSERGAKMFDLSETKKFVSTVVMAAVMLVGVSSLSYAQTGSVRITVTKVGFIVGMGGGRGTLTYKGKSYPLRVGGISLGTIGVASAQLVGTASNLRSAADIAGTYTAVSAGVAVAGGGKVAQLQNANGVLLQLRGKQVGFEVSLNLSGLTVTLQ